MSRCAKISEWRLLGRLGVPLALAAALFTSASGAVWAQANAPVDNTKIVIGIDNTGTAFTPLFVADQQGFFKKEGVDYDSQSLSGGTPTAMAALAGGSVN